MGRLDSVATLWSILVNPNRDLLRDSLTSLALCCLDQSEAYPQIVGPHHSPSRLLLNGVLDPDLLLVSILLKRQRLRSRFVVIGRP